MLDLAAKKKILQESISQKLESELAHPVNAMQFPEIYVMWATLDLVEHKIKCDIDENLSTIIYIVTPKSN